jgi:hypothetical protein
MGFLGLNRGIYNSFSRFKIVTQRFFTHQVKTPAAKISIAVGSCTLGGVTSMAKSGLTLSKAAEMESKS